MHFIVHEFFNRARAPNAKAALFFPASVGYKDVLKSLEIIAADLKHRIEMEEDQKEASVK